MSRHPTEPCGTPAAAKRHWRKNEPLCPACRTASRLDSADRKGYDPLTASGAPDHRDLRNNLPVLAPYYRNGRLCPPPRCGTGPATGALRGVDRLRDLAYGPDSAWHPVPPFRMPRGPVIEWCPDCRYRTDSPGHRIECGDD